MSGGRGNGGDYQEVWVEAEEVAGEAKVGTGGGSECWEVPAGEVSDDG